MSKSFDVIITTHGHDDAAQAAHVLAGRMQARGTLWDVTVAIDALDDLVALEKCHELIDPIGLGWREISVRPSRG